MEDMQYCWGYLRTVEGYHQRCTAGSPPPHTHTHTAVLWRTFNTVQVIQYCEGYSVLSSGTISNVEDIQWCGGYPVLRSIFSTVAGIRYCEG